MPAESQSSTTATSSSTRSRRATDGAALGFHRAGRWDEVLEIERCWLTTDLGNAIRDAVRDWAREERLDAYDQATQHGLPPPSRRARGAEHGPGARPARHRARRAVRARLLRRGAAALPRGALDPLGGQRHAAEVTNLPTDAALGRGGDRGGAPRPALPRAPERVPADEHARWPSGSTSSRASTPALTGRRDGLRPLLRHRHDRALAGARRADGLGRRDLGGVGRLRDRERRAERDRATRRSSPATSASRSRSCASGRASPTSSSSTRRARASPGKALRRIGALGAPRIVYVSCNPTTLAGDAKVLARRVRLRARARAARSTCSRTRRTSRRSRCFTLELAGSSAASRPAARSAPSPPRRSGRRGRSPRPARPRPGSRSRGSLPPPPRGRSPSAAARRSGPSSAQYAPGSDSYGMPDAAGVHEPLLGGHAVELRRACVRRPPRPPRTPEHGLGHALLGRDPRSGSPRRSAASRGRRASGRARRRRTVCVSGSDREPGALPRSSCSADQRVRSAAEAAPSGDLPRSSAVAVPAHEECALAEPRGAARGSRPASARWRCPRRRLPRPPRAASTSASTASSAGRFPWTS